MCVCICMCIEESSRWKESGEWRKAEGEREDNEEMKDGDKINNHEVRTKNYAIDIELPEKAKFKNTCILIEEKM